MDGGDPPSNPPLSTQAGFPAYDPDLLARLEQGEDVWIPDIQSSEEEEEEELARPLLRLLTRRRKRWRSCRDTGSSSGSQSSRSGKGLVPHPKTETLGIAPCLQHPRSYWELV